MKPTKMRNRLIYKAARHIKSKQLGSHLSTSLQEKYGKRSVRVVKGDNVKIARGEFRGLGGKINAVFTNTGMITLDSIKKEKTKGDKFDVPIHTTNITVTALNTDDKWRMARLQRKDPRKSIKTDVKHQDDGSKTEGKELRKEPNIISDDIGTSESSSADTAFHKDDKDAHDDISIPKDNTGSLDDEDGVQKESTSVREPASMDDTNKHDSMSSNESDNDNGEASKVDKDAVHQSVYDEDDEKDTMTMTESDTSSQSPTRLEEDDHNQGDEDQPDTVEKTKEDER